jgi:hypothetical protein
MAEARGEPVQLVIRQVGEKAMSLSVTRLHL